MYFHTAEVAITQICLLPSFIPLGQPLHRSVYFYTAESAIAQICVLSYLWVWVSHCTGLCTFILLSQPLWLHRSVYFQVSYWTQPLYRSVYFHTSESAIIQYAYFHIAESAIAQICVLSYCWVSHYDYTDLCTFKFHTGVSHYTDLCTFIPFTQPSQSMCTFRLLRQPLHRSVYFQTTQSTIRHSDLLLTHTVSVTVTVYQKVGKKS